MHSSSKSDRVVPNPCKFLSSAEHTKDDVLKNVSSQTFTCSH